MLSWMIEIWLKNQLVSANTAILQHCQSIMPNFLLQGMTNIVKLTFSVGDTTLRFTISIEEDN